MLKYNVHMNMLNLKKRQIKEFPAVLIQIIFHSTSLFEDTCYSNT